MTGELPLRELLAGDVVRAARELLGCHLLRRFSDGSSISGRIVETEAYHQSERACHAHNGLTPRNASMFGSPGLIYIYRIYGIYFCANIVCEPAGTAAAVLVRGLEPLAGSERRMSGPGLLCSALELSTEQDGLDLLDARSELTLSPGELITGEQIRNTQRVGFSFEDNRNWRFHIADNKHVSKGRPGVVVKRRRSSV
jgi:DNA-3-methyladenine glycosylase